MQTAHLFDPVCSPVERANESNVAPGTLVNKECDVEGLCNGFPKRIKLLEEAGGDRPTDRPTWDPARILGIRGSQA